MLGERILPRLSETFGATFKKTESATKKIRAERLRKRLVLRLKADQTKRLGDMVMAVCSRSCRRSSFGIFGRTTFLI